MPKIKSKVRPHRKSENRYRFSSFSQQIKSVSIASVQRYHGVVPDRTNLFLEDDLLLDQPSHLRSGIEEQLMECQTQSFNKLIAQLQPHIGSFKEVILHQRFIFSKLSKCILKADDFTLISILRLVNDFSRDVQSDFYAYFYQFIEILGSKSRTVMMPKCLVEIFSCLTKVMKVLLRTFVPEDMERFLGSLSPFMESKKTTEVKFASGAFAFICKKLLSVEAATEILYQTIYPKVVKSYHMIVIEMVEGVGVEFNSLISSFLHSLMEKLPEDNKYAASFLKLTIKGVLEIVAKHTRANASGNGMKTVWDCIKLNALSTQTTKTAIYTVLNELIKFNDGNLVSKQNLGNEIVELVTSVKDRFENQMNLWYTLCSSVFECLYSDELNPEIVESFKYRCFEFNPSTWRFFENFLTGRLQCDKNSLVQFDCVLSTIKVLQGAATNILVELTYDEVELLSGIDVRIEVLNLLLQLVIRTGCASKQNEGRELLNFVQIYLDNAEIIEELENAAFILICKLVPPTIFQMNQSEVNNLEQKLQISKSMTDKLLTARAQSVDQFLCYKAKFSYLLSHSRLEDENFSDLLEKIEEDTEDVDTLVALFSNLCHLGTQDLTHTETAKKICSLLIPNFRSYSSKVVLKTLEIFLCLNKCVHAENENCSDECPQHIFRKLYEIINIPDSFGALREKLVMCEKVNFQRISKVKVPEGSMITRENLVEITISFLFSLCFSRLAPLQKGVAEILVTFQNGKIERMLLANILSTLLKDAFMGGKSLIGKAWKLKLMQAPENNYDKLRGLIYKAVTDSENTSLAKKRTKLLGIFRHESCFASLAGSSFKYCFYEFLLNDLSTDRIGTSLRLASLLSELGIHPMGTCGPIELGESESLVNVLTAFLKILTSVPKTRELKNDQQILAILYRFLTSAYIFVQKPALECILSFQQEHLQPYMEYLHLLSNEKCVKKTLGVLKFSKENSIVNEVHRDSVLKFLFPFLHGRLYNSKWLANMQERFRVVCTFLKFLDNDLKDNFFLEVFEDCEDLMASSDTNLFAFETFDNPSISRMVVTLKEILEQLQSAHSFGVVRRVFRCVLSVALSLSRLKNQRRIELDSKTKRLLKQSSMCVLQFMKTSAQPVRSDEMNAILDEVVKPFLVFRPSQDFKGTKSTSIPLSLKFVEFLAENFHYRKYLEYKIDARNETTVLECLCSMYLSTTAVKEHQYFTVNILMSLISSKSDDNRSDAASDDEKEMDSDEDEDSTNDEEMDGSDVTGKQLLKSCSGNIVSFLQDKMLSGGFKSSPQSVKNSILELLTILIDEVDRPQDCVAMANTLSAFVVKRQTRYSLELGTITNITNLLLKLLEKCKNPVSVLLSLSSCFSENLPKAIRMKVCKIFSVMSEDFASILVGLNSWDQKAMDEPDFPLRFASFAKVGSLLNELEPKKCVIAVSVLFRNCCFFIHSVEDYGLRCKSVDCIKDMLNDYQLTRPLVKMMKFEVTRLLKGKLEDANLFNVTTVLTCLVQNGREFDKTLSALNETLLNNPDLITDLGHIQVQKRCKSLTKSLKLIASDTLDWKTIEFLFLPITWNVLSSLEEEKKKDPNLINALIELLKVCANKMSLVDLISYSEKCLDLLNRKKEHPKVPSRMFSAVLSAFGTNKAVDEWNSVFSGNQDDNIRSSLKSLAGKISSVLAGLKKMMSNKDFMDPNESNALITKIPLHIGSINVAKTLPENVRHFQTKNVLLSLCGFLRSRNKSVRHTTRGVMIEIILKLDKQYLNVLIQDLFSILDRGFRKDVLVFSLFRVLSEGKKVFKAGDLDIETFKQVAKFLCEDTFEAVGEERSTTKLGAKTPEASKTYAIPAYSTLGFYATSESLSSLLQPLDEVMETQCLDRSKNIVMRILSQLAVEILENNFLADVDILKFCEEVCTGNVAKILNRTEKDKTLQKRDPRLQPIDSVLLEPVPIRVVDRRPIVQTFMYHHVFLNFGLQLLLKLIQKVDLKSLKRPESLEVLQKLVPSIKQGLSSSYMPIVIQSVRCLKEFTSLPLNDVVTSQNLDKINQISEKYCRGNAVSNQLQELLPLLANCTKIFLSDKDFEIKEKQLSLVLAHVEEDLGESSKVKPSLDILQPIVRRKWKHENINGVMNTISKLMIQSEWPPNRVNCRNLYVDYLIHFVDKVDKMDKCLNFFIAQISTYSEATGRESALEFFVLFVSKADTSYLNRIAMRLFYPLCLVLANDSSETCCKLSSSCLGKLIANVDDERYQTFYQISFSWMKNREEFPLIKLGCMVCDLLLQNDVRQTEPKWKTILTILLESIEHCSAKQKANEVEGTELNVRQLDYTICSIFKLVEVIVGKIDVNGNFHQFAELLPRLFKEICDHLTYSHEWVQILCSQILAKIFSAIPANDFLDSKFVKTAVKSSVLNNNGTDNGRNEVNVELFESIVEKIFRNISYIEASNELREISLKDIVYLSLASISDFFNKKSTDLNLCLTIITNLKELAWQESVHNATSFAKRTFLLNWANYVLQSKEFVECLTMEVELLDKVLEPIVKELNSKATVERPKNYTEILGKTFEKFEKTLQGDSLFLNRYSKIIQDMQQKRLENKSALRKRALTDPELHNEMKLKKSLQTLARRKRKMAEKKGKLDTLKPGLFGSKRAKTEDEKFFESIL